MSEDGHSLRLGHAPRRGAPALFLDRDGTLIEDPGYLADPNGVHIIAGVSETLTAFHHAGYALVLVTNQSGIGRGLYSWGDYDAVAARLRDILIGSNIHFDAELACGHAPGESAACDWRKPGPGMIAAATAALDIDLSRSILVGDKLADMEAAVAAGVGRAVHVATGQGGTERAKVEAWADAGRVEFLTSIAALKP